MGWKFFGYILMQAVPIALVLSAGKYGYAIATAFWAIGNCVAYFVK